MALLQLGLVHGTSHPRSDGRKGPCALGGEGKIVEVDEAYHGKAETPIPSAHRQGRPYLKRDLSKQKRPIVALVERGGEARAKHMRHVTGKNMQDFVVQNADRKSRLHTDESRLYPTLGKEFATHETVTHSKGEYARGDVTINTVEGFFGIFKRGMVGVYQHCGSSTSSAISTSSASAGTTAKN